MSYAQTVNSKDLLICELLMFTPKINKKVFPLSLGEGRERPTGAERVRAIQSCFPVISPPGYRRPPSGGTHILVKRFKISICQVHTIG
jgi:hypothetical protein